MIGAAPSMRELVAVPRERESQTAALADWTYNLGVGALEESTLLRVLNDGHYALVSPQMGLWNHGRVDGHEQADCYRAAVRKESEADAAQLGLPALTGSPKQIAWAESLRGRLLDEIREFVSAEIKGPPWRNPPTLSKPASLA